MRFLTALLTAASLLAQQPAPAKRTGAATPSPTRTSELGPSYKDLKFPPLREVRIPEVATFTLPNGMKLYLLENHELPLVSGFALARTGNLFDPAGKTGLAELTGTVMRTGGTAAKTGDQLDEQLENIAASVESGIGETSGRVSFSAMKDTTDEVLSVWKELLTTPEFRQDKLDLAKTQLRSLISRRNDEASGIAGHELERLLYGKETPYGRQIEYADVDNIQRGDLQSFYQRYFFPANIMIAMLGDFNTAEMKAKLEKLFADWNVKQESVPPFPRVDEKAATGMYLAVKEDVAQTFFQLGHLGGVLKDKNYPTLSVMADILGGGFSSRLFKEIRTRLGYAYGVSASWGADYLHPGLFVIGGSTKSASTVDTLQAVLKEVEKMRTTEVTTQELETAKQSVVNSFVFFFDSPSKILNRVVTYEYYGYPKDFIFQYQKGVEAVTKADVLRVAKEYIHPELFATVAVGKPADFGKPLTTLGAVQNIDLTIPGPKGTEAAKADPGSLAKGKQLLQRAQQATGGAEALAGVKDYTSVIDVSLQTPQGSMKAVQTNQWIAPGTFRQTQEFPFGKMIVFSDGQGGWLLGPQGVMEMPPPVVQQVRGELFRNQFSLLLSDQKPDRTVNAVSDKAVEISDKSGNKVLAEFDTSTGRIAKLTFQSAGPAGAATVTSTPSDFKQVAGVWVPMRIRIEQEGKPFADGVVREWKVNTGLKLEELSKKP